MSTVSTLVSAWWIPGNIQPKLGYRFDLNLADWGYPSCQVVDVDWGQRLSYVVAPRALDLTISWRITPTVNGSLLAYEQSCPDPESSIALALFTGLGRGWPQILSRLNTVLSSFKQLTHPYAERV